tara:strand:+ start:305 stop:805 length:501 start_codon:yes stop_codon:yes gene_type:complete
MKNYFLAIGIFLLSISGYANSTENKLDELKKLQGKWMGTLERTDGTSDMLNIEYSITSNGSAILEESNTGGVEMLSIFNSQNDEILVTHYCGLQNKPVAILKSITDGTYYFVTDAKRSGLDSSKEAFVGSWKLQIMPDKNLMKYEYSVIGPDGIVFKASAMMTKMG